MQLLKIFCLILFLMLPMGCNHSNEDCQTLDCETSSITAQEFQKLESEALCSDHGILITKEDTSFVSPNFRVSDFAPATRDTVTRFYISCDFITAAEYIQEWLETFNESYATNVRLKFTSTFRSEVHNRRINGAKNSLHLIGRAVDIQFTNYNDLLIVLFALEINTRGYLKMDLEGCGINGYIFYKNHIHLSIRDREYFDDKRNVTLRSISKKH